MNSGACEGLGDRHSWPARRSGARPDCRAAVPEELAADGIGGCEGACSCEPPAKQINKERRAGHGSHRADGQSEGATTVRAKVSATTSAMAPPKADTGISMRWSEPKISRIT